MTDAGLLASELMETVLFNQLYFSTIKNLIRQHKTFWCRSLPCCKGLDVGLCWCTGAFFFWMPFLVHTDDSRTHTHVRLVKVQHSNHWDTVAPSYSGQAVELFYEVNKKKRETEGHKECGFNNITCTAAGKITKIKFAKKVEVSVCII